jgi:hypothetical protein
MGPQTVLEIIATKVVELSYVGLLGYGLHLTSAYLNHRLDVLGKDAFVFYRRDRYHDELIERTDGDVHHGKVTVTYTDGSTDDPKIGFEERS